MSKAKVFSLLLAWLIALGGIFANLGKLPLIDPDEGRNAEIAREMREAHSYIVPLYNGLPRLDKPAFYFDTVALSFNFFGENETAARLPSAIFGLFTLILVCLFCIHVYDLTVATLAVLILGTTPLFIIFSRTTILDMELTFFVTATLFAGYIAIEHLLKNNQTRVKIWTLLTVVSAAFATLVKGPVGFILPVIGLFAYLRSSKMKGGKYFLSPLNMFVFFTIVSIWFFSVLWHRPDFAYYGLFTETFERFFSTGKMHRAGSIYYYIPVLLAVFFPWSLLLTEMGIHGWRERSKALRADRLLTVFAIIVVLFFSVSKSKLPGYILPAIIALGILMARAFSIALKNPHAIAKQAIQRSTMLLVFVCGLAAIALATYHFDVFNLQQLIHLQEKISAQLQLLSPSMLVVLPIICLAGIGARLSRNTLAMLTVFTLTPILLGIVGTPGIKEYAEQISSRRLAEKIHTLMPEGGKVVCYKCMPTGLPFYLRQNVVVISTDGSELTGNYIRFFLEETPQWPAQIVHFNSAFQWFSLEKAPLFLLIHKQYKPGKIFAMMNNVDLQRITPRWLGGLHPPLEQQS
ncbi:Undecaprenyl phosphate-alpha-4-amino-4-deoxy-L-arabinose arabinosyl transferase [Legionella massiliensis]|uniref:Undecaprenyl phosphate-alpha-4-amino-4-deoxy-L-arabinose arabinosyl transferase n=1 Tax=Legionella massiliensis TaxID=1034943 RepID=A0A078KSW9_9GAMM|nr:glycosyltransferase family 39 protein [Legionella massiliensis]CDZ76047.1 Undecaprenyl phosphate-alpha-4-amino-4-deoxy-L-arabinose arabinosyl transferase [Legionella massiliensis]CEE11785.1 Undecaprenyl phosphate-alpha-4-amino-4-deoxy-L-arabinose arabinosyl transferase [Legionella massiliensis]